MTKYDMKHNTIIVMFRQCLLIVRFSEMDTAEFSKYFCHFQGISYQIILKEFMRQNNNTSNFNIFF